VAICFPMIKKSENNKVKNIHNIRYEKEPYQRLFF